MGASDVGMRSGWDREFGFSVVFNQEEDDIRDNPKKSLGFLNLLQVKLSHD